MDVDTVNLECKSRKDKFLLICVPKEFDINQLNGVEYDPHQILEIGAKKEKSGLVTVYELGAFQGKEMDLNLLVKSGNQTKLGPAPHQQLYVTRSVRLDTPGSVGGPNSSVATTSTRSDTVDLPQGLRERFSPFGSTVPPPFGSDQSASTSPRKYKTKKSFHDSETKERTKKHKRKDEDEVAGNDISSIERNQSLIQDEEDFVDSYKNVKKKKRKLREGLVNGIENSRETLIRSRMTEDDDDDVGNDSTIVSKSVDFIPLVSGDGDGGEKMKKHKKKKRRSLSLGNGDESVLGDCVMSTVGGGEGERHKEKRKKKKKDKD